MDRISDDLASATVLSADGTVVPFCSLYTARRTVVVFVRHFGCIFCRERIAGLTDAIGNLRQIGVDAVVIGNGTPLMAADFAETLDLELPLFTDPSRRTYALAGMKRNFGLNLNSVGHALRSMRGGHRQGAVAGDPWQQGGLIVVDPDGTVIEHHQDRDAGTYIDLNALTERLTQRAA